MNKRLAKLAERRAALAAEAASQRLDLAGAFGPWREALKIADHGLAALRFVARHKAIMAAVVTAAVALRPGGAFGLLPKVWRAWRTWLAIKRAFGG